MRDRRLVREEVSRAMRVEAELNGVAGIGGFSRLAVEHVIEAYESVPDPVHAAAEKLVGDWDGQASINVENLTALRKALRG